MPRRVRALRDRAERLQDRASEAHTDARIAMNYLDGLLEQRAESEAVIASAMRAVSRWSRALVAAQADYDHFQQILDDDSDYDLDIGDDIYDDPRYDFDPDLSPTTEDFGSGSGSVGLCNDGTLSDSIGRQGACSHHGGVAP
jgi:hypothetical protein